MTNFISIITAVHAPAAHHLGDAYRSLAAQKLPDGWDWQWVVQEDGETDAVVPHLPDDPRLSFGQGRHGRAGVARTLALSRAAGKYVKVLDADDQLTPGALARDLVALTQPGVSWSTSRVLDLLPDGSTVGFDQDPPEGPIQRGEVLEHWRAHAYRAPVHPATLAASRELVLALGGWMALPASEDTGLLMALNAVSTGWFTVETGLLYRKWSGQVTNDLAHTHSGERDARISVITARAEALMAMDWRVGN
ncbi:glycosyltransferase [Streptomyces sp. 549]|uniref:glycosyltransferase family 2 protein n=1 Tax=Streptomyces sp. 549 TaxID=3049076 RepID=UPI0024C33C6A|nr:glycosyltransferase [Streptomyces sp. 549]MDK1474937.1 glycosyltransferase [Streptomyces sp. 549]